MPLFSDLNAFRRALPFQFGVKKAWEYFQAQGDSYIGRLRGFSVTVGFADVATAGSKTLFAPATGETWRLHTLFLLGPFTNFSAGGDRLLSIKAGTPVYSVIPNATLESLAAARWGETALPFAATAAHGSAAIAAATPLVALYSGGTTDHDAGSLVLQGIVERLT
jgi:hypothetical protein